MTTEKAHAQNNVLQLAAGPGSSITTPPPLASFRHPVVYVEWGGHEFWPTPGWSIYGASRHNGLGKYSYYGNGAVDLGDDPLTVSRSVSTDIDLVRFFAGYWGADWGGGPPQGPALHLQWYWNPKTTPQPLLNLLKTPSVRKNRTY